MVNEEDEEENEVEMTKKEEVETHQERGRMMVVDTRYISAILTLSTSRSKSATCHHPSFEIVLKVKLCHPGSAV